MKQLQILIAVFLMTQTIAQAQLSFGTPELINHQWQFYLGDNPTEKTQWQTVDLPHDWSVREPLSPSLASCQGFLPGGIGWYRKTLVIPQEKQNEKIYLYFEGVYNRSEIFVNGQSVGARPNGYISFAYDITPYIQFGKENVVAVRVDHSQSADSRWYTGSGIYRNVWLVYANPVHIAQWGVFAFGDDLKAIKDFKDLKVNVEIANESSENASLTVINELFSPDGKLVAKNSQNISVGARHALPLQTRLTLKNPQLWDLEHPNLYTLKTTVLQNGKKIDETTTTTGFRSFVFDPDKGFFLNGKNLKMKGVCLHHDAGVLGAAVPREVWKRRLQTLKEIGVNAIRTSHNPQAPDLYDLCDELGILVLNEAYDEWEFPKNKWIEGWNVGTPGHQGTFDIFEKWGEQDLADMVRRDRNHVSVFAWSIGNEVDYPNDPYSHPILDGENKDFTQKLNGGYKKDAPDANRLGGIAKRLVAVVKQYDRSRPVTAGLAGVAMSNETEYPFALDICGYNYTESRYISDHKKYPNRVIFGSETRNELGAWKAVTDNEHIFGQFLWTGIDYLGESGQWPSRGFYSGLVDFAGFIKPRGYFRKALWNNEPTAYLGTYPIRESQSEPSMDAWSIWNYEEGQIIRVVCYANTEKAQLFLNDKPVGDTKNRDSRTGIIYWDIPFHAGKLEVRGFNGDREMVRYAVQTSGRPYEIKATVIPSVIKDQVRNDNNVWQIVLQVVDEKGIPVMLSDDEITCKIEGPAKLLGLEAGNNSDMGDYTDNVQRAFHGRLLAYIQTTGQTGEIKVIFSAPWLKSASILLTGCSTMRVDEKNHKGWQSWVTTWSTSQQLVEPNNLPPAPGLTGNTLRQIVRVSIGGDLLRLRFSNVFSNRPVTLESVAIAVSREDHLIDASTQKTLAFEGKSSVTIPAESEIYSDSVAFNLAPNTRLAITIHFGETSPDVTGHPGSRTTSYLLEGDKLSADFSEAVKTDHWYVIQGVDVKTTSEAAAIVALGNSITDGRGSGTNKQNRWTDVLSERLLNNPQTKHYSVLNEGIGGNCVLRGGLGPTALNRFDRDVLSQSGVRRLIILEGINDIGGIRDRESAPRVARELIDAYTLMIEKAHARGIKVYGCTILPFAKSFYDTPFRQEARDTVNEWIRNSGKFDAVIDFDKAMRSPDDPKTLLPDVHTGDFLHPNEAGYKMMGEFVDLGLLKE